MPEDKKDFQFRTFQVRADLVDEGDTNVFRTATLATEQAVTMYDWERYEYIPEILLASGMRAPKQVPLLDSHNRYSVDDQLGSVRNIKEDGERNLGDLHFSESDSKAQRTADKIREGHMTDLSAGYRVTKRVYIPEDETVEIDGREFRAGQGGLNVATEWRCHEVSVTPIGADDAAKIRGFSSMQAVEESEEAKEARCDSCGGKDKEKKKDSEKAETDEEKEEREDSENNDSPKQTRSMPTPAPPAEPPPETDVSAVREAAFNELRTRNSEIGNIRKEFVKDNPTLETHAIELEREMLAVPDTTLSDFQSALRGMRQVQSMGPPPTRNTMPSTMDQKDVKRYRIQDAAMQARSGKFEGLYAEVDTEMTRSLGSSAGDNGFHLPTEALFGASRDAEIISDPIQNHYDGRGSDPAQMRAANIHQVGVPELGGVSVDCDLMPLIPLFRDRSPLRCLGATFVSGLKANTRFPRQVALLEAFWGGECDPCIETYMEFDDQLVSPNRLTVATCITNQLLCQSEFITESLIRREMADAMNRKIGDAALIGSGEGNIPLGLFNTPGVGVKPMTNPTEKVTTYQELLQLEACLCELNIDCDPRYLISCLTEACLKGTNKCDNGCQFIIDDGTICGNPYCKVPSGYLGGNRIAYGCWNDLYILMWCGIRVVVDPYTKACEDALKLTMHMNANTFVRRPESFVISDGDVLC